MRTIESICSNINLNQTNLTRAFIAFCRKDLINQEANYTAQLAEAESAAIKSQAKADDLAYQITELERNLTVHAWNVERKFVCDLLKIKN